MASVSPGAVLGACAAAAAIACTGALVADISQPEGLIRTTVAATMGGTTQQDAVRLAKQATFGPTKETVDAIVEMGTEAWIESQFEVWRGSSYVDLKNLAVPRNYCNGRTGQDATDCNRAFFSANYPGMRFYADAIQQPDQLRQRVALALGQTIVASANSVNSAAGIATFNQIFLDHAFGNYRDILTAVTLNPMMGGYLNMADSNRTAPNENYARELMQLFSIGVNLIQMDGTLVRDDTGAPIPSYTQADVRGIARALTGWTYARLNNAAITDGNQLDYTRPMQPVAARYDTAAKSFLGRTVPLNAPPEASVDAVVAAVFEHANTPPFVAKALIKQLVTSNPSPAYVERVARVFADNGAGVRGDMRATIKAMLLDGEARGVPFGDAGKVKEPILLLTSLGRAIGEKTDGYVYYVRDAQLGQGVFRAPSVFNFYPPDYPLPLGEGLESGPSKLLTTATALARHNLIYDWTVNGDQASRAEYNAQTFVAATGTQVDWTGWEALAGDNVDAAIDRIDLLLLGGTMSAAQRTAMKTAMNAITNTNLSVQARRRAQVGLYIAASSPQFQVDR